MQPKTTIAEASEAVKEDILRSLTSRLEMHWDSLIEEENSEGKTLILTVLLLCYIIISRCILIDIKVSYS